MAYQGRVSCLRWAPNPKAQMWTLAYMPGTVPGKPLTSQLLPTPPNSVKRVLGFHLPSRRTKLELYGYVSSQEMANAGVLTQNSYSSSNTNTLRFSSPNHTYIDITSRFKLHSLKIGSEPFLCEDHHVWWQRGSVSFWLLGFNEKLPWLYSHPTHHLNNVYGVDVPVVCQHFQCSLPGAVTSGRVAILSAAPGPLRWPPREFTAAWVWHSWALLAKANLYSLATGLP